MTCLLNLPDHRTHLWTVVLDWFQVKTLSSIHRVACDLLPTIVDLWNFSLFSFCADMNFFLLTVGVFHLSSSRRAVVSSNCLKMAFSRCHWRNRMMTQWHGNMTIHDENLHLLVTFARKPSFLLDRPARSFTKAALLELSLLDELPYY